MPNFDYSQDFIEVNPLSTELDFTYRMSLKDYNNAPEIDELTNQLMPLMAGLGQQRVVTANLRFLITELHLSSKKEGRYLAYPRGNSAWSELRKLDNPNNVSSKLAQVIDRLVDNGLIEHYLGYHDRSSNTHAGSRLSRARPTPALLDLLSRYQPSQQPRQHPALSLVQIRSDILTVEQLSALYTHPIVEQSKQMLSTYNALINRTHITADELDTDTFGHILTTYRVFNDGLDKGGRYYGPWWTSIKKELRPTIRINGEPTVELDYSAQHPHLVYGYKAGLSYQTAHSTPKDIYAVAGHNRNHIKQAFLKMLNTDSMTQAWRATKAAADKEWSKLREQGEDTTQQQDWVNFLRLRAPFEDLANAIREHHSPILPYFYTNLGPYLTRIDSQIAHYILEQLTQQDIPVLCIHDSFIVRERDMDLLGHTMTEAYLNQSYEGIPLSNSLPPIKVKSLGSANGSHWHTGITRS